MEELQGESEGILNILSLIKADIEKDIEKADSEEAAAQAAFELPGPPRVRLVGKVAGALMPHQRIGVEFLYSRLAAPNGGCLCCDSMGLGKTIQAIATIHALTEARLAVRTVVAAPASLLDNWLHETKRWLGFQLPVEVLRSSGAKAYSQVSLFAQKTTGSRILIASYEGLRSHAERLHDRVDLLVSMVLWFLRAGVEPAMWKRDIS